ncbi:hypothetical protein NGRA_1892 [Nosema granulosis]|uniref:Uncharacterized protein n=1 Tax=Nosema granulosis TaxID=83296 RepID=A0A9P6KZ57_9MICR|nr:hypothetical protein NGRA_1892 [Nosema granulosis]
MSKYYVLILNMMIFFQSVTFSLYNHYFFYNFVKTFFFVLEGSITYTGNREIYRLKYISLATYSLFSITAMVIVSYLVYIDKIEVNFIYILNELNTIFSTLTNFLDYLWYGTGLASDEFSNTIKQIK